MLIHITISSKDEIKKERYKDYKEYKEYKENRKGAKIVQKQILVIEGNWAGN